MFLIGGAIERAKSIAKSHSVALSRLRLKLETLEFTADLNIKSVTILLILNSSFSFLIFILHLWFPLKSTFYLEISRIILHVRFPALYIYSYIYIYIYIIYI